MLAPNTIGDFPPAELCLKAFKDNRFSGDQAANHRDAYQPCQRRRRGREPRTFDSPFHVSPDLPGLVSLFVPVPLDIAFGVRIFAVRLQKFPQVLTVLIIPKLVAHRVTFATV